MHINIIYIYIYVGAQTIGGDTIWVGHAKILDKGPTEMFKIKPQQTKQSQTYYTTVTIATSNR